MSTLTEITLLEGIDLDGSPPCGLLIARGWICGKPAVSRARFGPCPEPGCSPGGLLFLCTPCVKIILERGGKCGGCWQNRDVPFGGFC